MQGVYDPKVLVYENKIITSMLSKANASMPSINHLCITCPRVIISDFELEIQTSSIFLTFDNSIRFFTCYSFPVLSFHFYVSAFEIQAWIAILLSGILLATFLKYHIYYNISKTLNFSTVLFYFSIFMEESYSIPSKISNNRVYRTATILWLLVAVVYTNTYISHVISGLNAPLTGKQIGNNDVYGNTSTEPEIDFNFFSNFNWLLETLQEKPYLYFSADLNGNLEGLLHHQNSKTAYTMLSEPLNLQYPEDVWIHLRNQLMYSNYYNNLLQLKLCIYKFFPQLSLFCRTVDKLMKLSNKFHPDPHTFKRPWNFMDYPTGAVEETLINCQKSVYAERSDQLEFKYLSENCKKKRFYYLKDSFFSTQNRWSFYNLQKSKLPFYFGIFLQSGIFHELHKLKLFRGYQKRRSMTSEIIKRTHNQEVLDMSSSVQTVFIIFAAMTLLAKLAFVAEFSYFECKKCNLKLEFAKLVFGAKSAYHFLFKGGNFKRKVFKLW